MNITVYYYYYYYYYYFIKFQIKFQDCLALKQERIPRVFPCRMEMWVSMFGEYIP